MMANSTPRDPLGGAQPDDSQRDPTSGGQPTENVQDPGTVERVTLEDYPRLNRASLDDGRDNRGKRRSKGSGPVSGSGAGAGGKGNDEDYDADPQGGGGNADMRTNNGPKTGADAPVGGGR